MGIGLKVKTKIQMEKYDCFNWQILGMVFS